MSDNKDPKAATAATAAKNTEAVDLATKIVEQLLPSVIAAAKSGGQQSSGPAAQHVHANGGSSRNALEGARQCDICRFWLKKHETSETHEHEMVVAYPTRYPDYAAWFQGVKLSGVLYLSDHERHEIVCPKGAAGTIRNLVENWERHEHESRVGKVKTRTSGVLSGKGGSSVNPIPADSPLGWR